MTGPSGGRLARLGRRATLRAAALTGGATTSDEEAPAVAGLPPPSAPRVVGAPDDAPSDPLAAWLYTFGSRPIADEVDPAWPQLLLRRAEAGVRHDLARYIRTTSRGWMSWTHHDCDVTELVHKVYTSPAVPALSRALPIVLRVAIATSVPAWKVGTTLAGLHRADKVVLYLPTAALADATATALDQALSGLPAQGVPFTGQVGASGMVSRGLDRGGTSWRALICQALAGELRRARTDLGERADASRVAEAALVRLADAGYDTTTWAPAPRAAAVA